MLKRVHRLTSNFEFNVTRKHGKYYEGNFFHIYFLKPRNYKGPTKVGIVVSTKTTKKATKRNRVKRVFREVVRKNFEKIDKGDLWIVIHPKVASLNKKYEEINTDFNKILQKVSIPS